MRMYFQGEPGAFSEAAVLRYFPEYEPFGLASFGAVFQALEDDPAAVALLPIENAYRGTVYEVLDLLSASALSVWAEVVQPVTLALLGLPGQELAKIRRVRSHPQALMQSRKYWESRGWTAEPALDTAGSAHELLQNRWPDVAAIAGPRVAGIYGLEILDAPIEDHPDNRTRFWLISSRPGPLPAAAIEGLKASLVFDLPNRPGSLVKALLAFSEKDFNLTKVESRPRPGRPFEFRFWLDVVFGEEQQPVLLEVLRGLSTQLEWHRWLGIYPVARYSR